MFFCFVGIGFRPIFFTAMNPPKMCPVSSLPPTKIFAKIWVSLFPIVSTQKNGVEMDIFTWKICRQNPRIHVKALVILDYSYEPSHYSCVRTLGDWLSSQGIPGIYGVDTRAITKIIRQHLAFWEKNRGVWEVGGWNVKACCRFLECSWNWYLIE